MDYAKAFYGIEKDYFIKNSCAFTSEEIAQQPELWNDLAYTLSQKQEEILQFIKSLGDLNKIRIIFTGAGSSAFVGETLSTLITKSTGIRTEAIHTTDIVSAPESYLIPDIPTLLVSFARSGNSPESVGAVKYAREAIKELYEVAIICNKNSSLYEFTQNSERKLTLLMPEGSNDRGFAMTSSVSCMLLAGFALFNADKIKDIRADISLLASNVEKSALKFTEAAKNCADMEFDRIAFLGCAELKHVAHEAALKIMELTNGIVNGSFDSPTGFRHGPKSVIKDKTVTVHLISGDKFTSRYDMDLLNEVNSQKKLNKTVVLSGDDSDAVSGDIRVITSAKVYNYCYELCISMEMLVFCQMLAMFKSLSIGITTDDPSPSGEINRVVKGVTIYDYTRSVS